MSRILSMAQARWRPDTTALVISGSLVMAFSAHIAVRVPFSPVPITGQTLALPLIVAALGRNRAVMAIFLYLAEGASGLPVFAPGGIGPFTLIGPTAGYLWGFLGAAWLLGTLFELGLVENVLGRLLSIALSDAVVFALGAVWLAHFVGIDRAFALGVTPFLVGDALKVGIATFTAPAAFRVTAMFPRH
ncbi:biotin transporter BioY [bacterium]|nr:MAG: biotin transporter BioY [bacterium]